MPYDAFALTTTETLPTCHVCSLEIGPDFDARCMVCGQPFHLKLKQDLDGEECGDVWISEETMSLDFRCRPCLEPEPEGSLDDVLDLEEAAVALKMSPSQLLELAALGQAKHRKTPSGVFLFKRGDIAHLREN